MRTFTYTTWGGSARTVEAKRVEFHPGYVAFVGTLDDGYRLVIAEREVNCNSLRETDPS